MADHKVSISFRLTEEQEVILKSAASRTGQTYEELLIYLVEQGFLPRIAEGDDSNLEEEVLESVFGTKTLE